jgi:outer membrane protein assembly factor BamB
MNGSPILALSMWLALAGTAVAAEWSQFRGPAGDGHAAAQLPVTWSETENVAWKTEIPGRGWSSPVTENGTIWLTTAIEDKLTDEEIAAFREAEKAKGNGVAAEMQLVQGIRLQALAIDGRSGELLRTVELFDIKDPGGIHSLNSFASPTPIADAGRLFCHFGTYGTACVETETGKVLWQASLPLDHGVGPGSSPVLSQNLLIIPCDGVNEQYVVALDANTGKTVWKTARPPMEGSRGDLHKAFSTPLVVEEGPEAQVIIIGAQWAVSYRPLTGEEVWRVNHGKGFSNVPRPIIGHGRVYLCTGFMRPELWAIDLFGKGDLAPEAVAWKYNRQVPTMPSPVLVGERIYFIHDQGVMTCLNSMTGEEVWQKRVPGNYSASLLAAGDRIYLFNRDGEATIIKAGDEFEEIAINKLDGAYMSSPAVLGNDLIVRTETHLYRIGSGK